MSGKNGFSLIELLIALGISSTLLVGIIAITSNLLISNAYLINIQETDESVERIAALVDYEVSRHNYGSTTSLVIDNYQGEVEQSCILFAYDTDYNGELSTSSPNEYKGFRLRDSAIEMRVGQRSCSEGGWQDISDPNSVSVTSFQFFRDQINRVQLSIAAISTAKDGREINVDKSIYLMNL